MAAVLEDPEVPGVSAAPECMGREAPATMAGVANVASVAAATLGTCMTSVVAVLWVDAAALGVAGPPEGTAAPEYWTAPGGITTPVDWAVTGCTAVPGDWTVLPGTDGTPLGSTDDGGGRGGITVPGD